MFARAVVTFLLVALPLFVLAHENEFVLAQENESRCGTVLGSYCCESFAGPYPRGYVGQECVESSDDICDDFRPYSMCCQQLDNGVAYYCGQPMSAMNYQGK
ncbi:hypothetical protein FPV67DRAFT_1453435 [Lyophyllum atratum]|nr:hypothetical protein FPV67DRAFT_1453435 [Lyophyllum atratum]